MVTRNRGELSIGQLAAQFGINPKTIRYYEDIGLLPKPQRRSNGYRRYAFADQERLRFILQAKDLGFNIKEITEILIIRSKREIPCVSGQLLLDRKISAIEEQIRALNETLHYFNELRREAETTQLSPPCICGIIEQHTIPTPG